MLFRSETVGRTAMHLGAGRIVKEDVIDPSAGIVFCRRVGECVAVGDPLATLMTTAYPERLAEASAMLSAAIRIEGEAPQTQEIILDIIG